jgi:hypothetical protein
MRAPLPTPDHLVLAARLALVPCLAGLAGAMLVPGGAPVPVAATAGLAALVLLQAFPAIRAGDLMGLLALAVTALAWLYAARAGAIDAERWQAGIAVAGAAVALLKVQHTRALARSDRYVPLRQLERRNAVLARPRRARLPGQR